MKQLFLPEHQDKADKELDCYGYLLINSIGLFSHADFEKAAAYHENIARSLKELGRMKEVKEKHDRDWLKYKQIEGEQQQKKLLFHMQVNIYE
ncbi:hypothetical protein [Paucisalibacillus globulus]|uniref:hypothetical protein n=1 Tax=Paucisalibacillus globulus TaxID=351095 RepID=UPI000418E67C|nr:hypothetical protein [Paucisalibacillus globulus]